MTVNVSVPGKVYLMGEHAIVHGAPAIAAAINLRMYVSVRLLSGGEGSLLEIFTQDSDNYVRQIVDIVKKELGIASMPHVHISIRSEIPSGYHLGSSAAAAVGVTGALMYALKKIWNPVRINEIAYEAEKLQHGNPSGGDNTTITFGGLVWYRKELEFLKSIWSLPFKPHPDLHNFYLIDTGRPVESTGEMVSRLGKMVEKNKKKFREIFDRNETETKRITYALKDGNEEELLRAIQMGERTLEEMDVVSEKAKKIIRQVEKSGGAAKILGGGGKADGVGYLLCYHKAIKPALSRIKTIVKPVPITLGEEGVRLEKS